MDARLSRSTGEHENGESDPLTDRLVRTLAALPPGTKLPSERMMAEQLGVSRTALRDRFSRLESMGVLERRSGSGTYVQRLSALTTSQSFALSVAASNLDSVSMLPVRHALEREAARLASKRVDHMSLARMAVSLETMTTSESDALLQDADYAFHEALLAASGSEGLVFFADVLRGVLWGTIQRLKLSEDKATLREVHTNVYRAVVAQDPIRAMTATDEHFEWLEELLAATADRAD